MKKILSLWIALITLSLSSYTQTIQNAVQNDNYQFFINLGSASGNQIPVQLITPKISSDKILYRFPAMVPGTYSVYDYGRFISDLHAYDNSGKELSSQKKDVNSWEISDAGALYKITYTTKATFFDTAKTNPVFQMAGSNIQTDTNFVINNHLFFGYFENYINNPYALTFTKPSGFYGATSLNVVSRDESSEVFSAPDYHFLVDNPIMFDVPDTASVIFDESKVMISVYSESRNITASDISATIKPMLNAIREFLGGKLPVDKYTFLFYFAGNEKPNITGINGALEHSYSSFYFMTDITAEQKTGMLRQVRNFISHEFMHIVTPLTLHSEEIGNFDFNNPVMSEHLWLYEGTTEYNAHYIQLKEGLITLEEYLKDVERKMENSSRYNDTLPFTVMSKGVLAEYKDQYDNVYEKGALIALCLDVLIRDESDGKIGLQDVITSLSEKYGKGKSFRDEDLFGDITSLTTAKVGEFLNSYVGGPEHLPFKETFDRIGLSFEAKPYRHLRFGIGIGFNPETRRLRVNGINHPNEFAKALGFKIGDEFVSINGKELTIMNIRDAFGSVKNQIKDGDNFEMVVARKDDNGAEKNVTLNAKVSDTQLAYQNTVSVNPAPNERQLKIRNSWLGK